MNGCCMSYEMGPELAGDPLEHDPDCYLYPGNRDKEVPLPPPGPPYMPDTSGIVEVELAPYLSIVFYEEGD